METEIIRKFWTALLVIFAIATIFIFIDGTAIASAPDICDQNDIDTIELKGEFSFFTIYDEPHKKIEKPGKYWTVYVYWRDVDGNVVGSCSTRTNGSFWQIKSKRPPKADSLSVAVFSENEYVSVVSSNGSVYKVASVGGKKVPPNQRSFDTGKLVADLSQDRGGHLVGVGDVMAAATRFWDRTWDNGLDVKSRFRDGREKTIRIYFPNTWNDCGNTKGVPATCSSGDWRADIWISGRDITEFRTVTDTFDNPLDMQLRQLGREILVMHELAHQLNADRWNFEALNSPAFAALTEGFATAIAAWAIHGETEASPWVVWLDDDRKACETNLEAADQQRCTAGEQDKDTHVARLFWDLIDKPYQSGSQNDDDWAFPSPLKPFEIYLKLPTQGSKPIIWNDIGALKDAFKAGLNVPDRKQVDEIFRLNKQALP